MDISSPDAASEDRLLDTGIADPAIDLEAPRRKAPLLEIGVVESGEDQTYKCPLCQVSMFITFLSSSLGLWQNKSFQTKLTFVDIYAPLKPPTL
jgi:hypothetical protein